MKRLFWNRVLVVAYGAAILGGATLGVPRFLAQPAIAQSAADLHTIYLWDSAGATDTNVSVSSWGNGKAVEKKGVDYASRSALIVTTHNFYEGARFNFAQPVDLAPYQAGGVLRLRLRSERQTSLASVSLNGASSSSGGFSGAPGFPSSMPYTPQSGGGRQSPYSGGNPGATSSVYNPFPSTTPTPTPDAGANVPEISKIQVVMHLERGALFGQLDFGSTTEAAVRADQFGWQSFVLPLQSLRATVGAGGALRSVVLTGDTDHTFQLAQLALAPVGNLSVSIRRADQAPGTQQTELTISTQTPLRLVADVESGNADPEIEWNFDADRTGSLPPSVIEQPLRLGFSGQGVSVPGSGMPGRDSDPSTMRPGGGGRRRDERFSPDGSAISLDLPRLDGRGLVAQFTYPNEEQDYRVEVTVRDRFTRIELGKASLLIHVRSAE